jgi:HD-GYP domain-containing protein (c-di-GMP phosphodiesterase class II)
MSQLAAALDGTLAALGQMTENRDPYTAGHQIHVGALGSSLAAAIATECGLDLKMIELIRQSGDVHDIGKVAVPSEILTKPGRLSPLEFEMVKQHTLAGYDILSRASLPWPIAEVAVQHHERLDGSGYPNGLPGDQIILPARIIAVADVVEAMSQHRPYRPGLGIDKALAEMTEGAGTRFDANVVKCCLAVFEAGFTFEAAPGLFENRPHSNDVDLRSEHTSRSECTEFAGMGEFKWSAQRRPHCSGRRLTPTGGFVGAWC